MAEISLKNLQKFIVVGDRVLIRPEEDASRTASGLYLPDNATEKPKTAKILAVGKDVKQVKVGDRIVYKSYSTTDVKVGDEDYVIVKEEDILATVK